MSGTSNVAAGEGRALPGSRSAGWLLAWVLGVGAAAVGFLAPVMAAAGPGASLGTARGVRGVDLSFDRASHWVPLGGHALPVLDGVVIRSRGGGALVDLVDGSRVDVLAFSSVRIRESGPALELSLHYGRLAFRLPEGARVTIKTAAAHIEPGRVGPTVGELFATPDGTTGLRIEQGTGKVHDRAEAGRSILASTGPLFLPRPPAGPRPLFSADLPATPTGAREAFGPQGESLGYLRPDGWLVVDPGHTADLAAPFPKALTQRALGRIPAVDRADATPVFDASGTYAGYVAGGLFYGQATGAEPAPSVGGGVRTWSMALPLLAIPAGVVIGMCASGNGPCGGGGASQSTATPLRPLR